MYSKLNRVFWAVVIMKISINIGMINIFPDFLGWAIFIYTLKQINHEWENDDVDKSLKIGALLTFFYVVVEIGVFANTIDKTTMFFGILEIIGSILSVASLGLFFIGTREEISKISTTDGNELESRTKHFLITNTILILGMIVYLSIPNAEVYAGLFIIFGGLIGILALYYTLSIPYFIKTRKYFKNNEVSIA